ncbi:MAG: hypothetical protein PHH84_07120 [Oscillospiraceae bacterium]|nr:hypothetical protein [Oscillospiraceae bacterium]MDD4413320.1 hypothetical protein [Oscillospiraceae bacterium]
MRLCRSAIIASVLSAFLTAINLNALALPATGTTDATTVAQDNISTEDSLKTFRLTKQNGQGMIIQEPSLRMFWEYPLLPAGQTRQGKIIIRNETEKVIDLKLFKIILPKSNKAAMDYLSSLKIKVTDPNGTVLYKGYYNEITDRNELDHFIPSPNPGEAVEYFISMHCRFNYSGVPSNDTAPVVWNIIADEKVKFEDNRNNGSMIFNVSLIIFAISFGALTLLYIFRDRNLNDNSK